MKHSQTIGIIAVILMIGVCFMPWSYIASKDLTISGMNAIGTDFGRPGKLNLIFAAFSIVLFSVPKIWAKRTNVFIAALNLSWSFRNYLLVTGCMMGECPEKRLGIFLLVTLAIIIQAMSLLPKTPTLK
jgi:hypothetical protein